MGTQFHDSDRVVDTVTDISVPGMLPMMGMPMTSIADTDDRVVSLARGMRDLVQAEAAESERMRTLTPAIVDEMWASGLMSAFNPVAAGGVEPSFAEMIETWIEMAWQDGSFGWIGIANLPSSFAAAAYLPDEGFAEVFTAHDNRVTLGGQFFPNGQGTAVDGGYLLNGSWNFGSGIGHSQYVAAGFLPMDNGEMRWISEGLPEMRVAVMPRDQISFNDGWYVQGLKGTGSYDYSAQDVFVPAQPHLRTVRPPAVPGHVAGHPDGADARHRRRVTHRGRWVWPRACSTTSRSWPQRSSG